MKRNYLALALAASLSIVFLFSACNKQEEEYVNKENKYIGYEVGEQLEEGYVWPEGQMLPTMAKAADVLDSVNIAHLSDHEKVAYSYLQGLVNKKKPRIFLNPSSPGEGSAKVWPENLGLEINLYAKEDKFELLNKYKDEINGIILYNRKEQGNDYINLACTVGGIKNAIPVDVNMQEKLIEAGINLPVVEDLTSLTLKGRIEIYNYLYDNYWKQCQSRLLFSLDSVRHKYFVRDMAAATGAAIVWLDNEKKEEKEVFCKFLADMEPGKSMVTGWYTEERSGIGAAAEYGLSTVPSDFFENSTVYAAADNKIIMHEVPNKPELENKVYIAIFLSDGDNVQYCQHAMYSRWMDKKRGEIPLNWTISPALVDFAPGMLNHYYKTATQNDFFASGPSGLGYSLLIDELNGEILNLKDPDLMAKYAQLTQVYQERSGLRVITAWDLVNEVHREGYEKYTRYLYGVTYQIWRKQNRPDKPVYFTNDRLTFSPNVPCYAMNAQEIINEFKTEIEKWDGNSPLFLNAQGNVWEMTVTAMNSIVNSLESQFKDKAAGKIELLRGDHYFALLNEANGKPFDLSISSKLTATASSNNDDAKLTIDGNPTGDSFWKADGEGEQWLKYDLGGEYIISRYVLRHAGDNRQDKSLNTKNYVVEVSTNGNDWTVVDDYRGNEANVTDIDIEPVKASYLRVTIKDAGADKVARIAEIEIYGAVEK